MQSERRYTIGTIVQSVFDANIIVYKIRPDEDNGHQSKDVYGIYPPRRHALPAGVRVAYRNELPGDEPVFPGARIITGAWLDGQLRAI